MGGRARATYLTGGARWWTRIGGLVPEASLGYRYRFGDRRSNITAAFLGDESNAFDVGSRAEKPGAVLAGLKVGGTLGEMDLRLGYEGEFNSGVANHAGNLQFILPLGGRAAARGHLLHHTGYNLTAQRRRSAVRQSRILAPSPSARMLSRRSTRRGAER